MLRALALTLAALLCGAPVYAATTQWDAVGCQWHYGTDNVRNPTIVYNVSSLPTYGACPGYDGLIYEFHPCNFPPNTQPGVCSDGTGTRNACPDVFTTVFLNQFNIPDGVREVQLTGTSSISGPNMWTATVYAWFRRPGSTWALSPIFDGGYRSTLSVPVPVGYALNADGVMEQAIQVAWRAQGATLAPAPNPDTVTLVMILSGYCK